MVGSPLSGAFRIPRIAYPGAAQDHHVPGGRHRVAPLDNVHRAVRAGIAFKDMSDEQRARGYALLQAGLSARGLEKTRNVMKLNHTIAEITHNFTEYGEGLYNLTVMGQPSAAEPWGWSSRDIT